MTVTLHLTPAEEAKLAEAARQEGIAPDALLKRIVNRLPFSPSVSFSEPKDETGTREAVISAALGSLAHVGASVEDLHRERQADKAREEQQVQEHRL